MARRRKAAVGRSAHSLLKAMTRAVLRVGSAALKEGLHAAPPSARRPATAKAVSPAANWTTGMALGAGGPRRYRLYQPSGVRHNERLPLLVMLHGCRQDAEALAASSRMNRIAARERFYVLYPEQDLLANAQRCWNWYDTRSGRAQAEVHSIAAAIDQVSLRHAIDGRRVALAGISAGAAMAVLLATRHPERFRAVVMHSGIAPGVAHSSASALQAMVGQGVPPSPLPTLARNVRLPPLLVIHGAADPVVAPRNGAEAALRWAEREGATRGKPRTVQRGKRYAMTVVDYRQRSRLVATHCLIHRLGHAWSGGAGGHAYSDPKGPDASRMIWTFVARQFASPAN
ncbi:MAG TPA: PHB depolymerase family esterase [Azonexus sp.]|nr:PHB depolymerase family esterase [Azonexus sp.]